MSTAASGFSRTMILVALAVSTLSAQAPGAPASPAGNADSGKRLFTSYYCYACHGTQGQGGTAGVRIAPRPIAFAAFERYLRQPTAQMPPYKATVVTDRDVADLYAFLRSIPAGNGAKSIPLLNQ